jgi:hypothetical protein
MFINIFAISFKIINLENEKSQVFQKDVTKSKFETLSKSINSLFEEDFI